MCQNALTDLLKKNVPISDCKERINKIFKNFAVLLFLFSISIASAQPEVVNVLPPSMDNYNFTKYGGLEMSGNSGSFSYSAPLYTISYNGIQVPISLSYFTDGVKVNDIAGIAGMSWNLVAGGMITRVVKDEPDEFTSTIKYRPTPEHIRGIVEGLYDDAYYLANVKQEAMTLWETADGGNNYQNKIDTEQDAFSFNFNGHSGNFYIENGQIYLDTDENEIKAFFDTVVIGTKYYLRFIFITPDGTKYTFGGADEFVESSEIAGACAKNYGVPIPTAWHLKQIEANQQVVTFSYTTIFKHYPYDFSQSATYRINEDNSYCNSAVSTSKCTNDFDTSNAKVLKQINFGTSKVVFNYLTQREDYYSGYLLNDISVHNDIQEIDKFNFEYVYSVNNSTNVPNYNTLQNRKRAFLQRIRFRNNTTQEFAYNNINGLSPRLSYSQDVYGYTNTNRIGSLLNVNFDGDNDNTLKGIMKEKFPGMLDSADRSTDPVASLYGVLNRITYPTKGYTDIAYENNLNLEDVDEAQWVTESFRLRKTACNANPQNNEVSSIQVPFTGNGSFIMISATATANPCGEFNGIDNLHTGHHLKIEDLTRNMILYSKGNEYNENFFSDESTTGPTHNATFAAIKTDNGSKYLITYEVETRFDDIRSNVTINYNKTFVRKPKLVNYSGARVKTIADYDSNGAMYNKKEYRYNVISDPTPGKTSLYHNFILSPWKFDCIPAACYPGGGIQGNVDCRNIITFGSSNYLAGLASRGNRINYHTISTILTNGNAIENKFYVNYGENDSPQIVVRRNLDNTTRSNRFQWRDGQLEQTIVYNLKNNIYVPAKKSVTLYDVVRDVSFYNYNSGLGIKSGIGFSGMEIDKVSNATPVGCTTLLCNLRGKFSMERYFNYCIVRAKTQTIETEYINGNEFVTSTKYFHSAPNHTLLTSQTTVNSDLETIQNKYYYAPDTEMVNQPFRNEIIAKNMIQQPLKTETIKDGNKLSEQLTVYDNSAATSGLLLPKYVYTAKFPSPGNLEKKITYDKYDDKGNILQFTPENGTPVAVIWGYNKTQPIAKIENATYEEVASYVANLQSLSNVGSEANLINALNALRTNLPNAMISTYTYIPLVGVSTITDAKGDTITYTYDAFNRLHFVKDAQGNLLSENQYHYINQ